MFFTALYRKTRAYHFVTLLLCSILCGALTGYIIGPAAVKLKPFGDIFLNLMYTLVVPLIFFSLASAIASMEQVHKMWRILSRMLFTFLVTSIIAAVFMVLAVKLFPLHTTLSLPITAMPIAGNSNMTNQLANILTVSNFSDLLNRDNMLALIFISILIGFATVGAGEKAKPFQLFLQAGSQVSMKAIEYIMYYAPIGFFAYFAVLVGQAGPELIKDYMNITILYYSAALLYFLIGFSLFAYFSAKRQGVSTFWKNSIIPATTAIATCSSAASIPTNLLAAKKIGVPEQIYELVIPLGSIIHKDGSVLGGVIKIAFLFSIFHLPFVGIFTLLTAILIALLVGTVMGAIPGGGMIGEMLILSVYGFPPQALIIVAAISILIDPPATLLNVTGNTICSMIIARLVEGKNWLQSKPEPQPITTLSSEFPAT